MDTDKGHAGTQSRDGEYYQPIFGPWRYVVAAAPMVGLLTLVALFFYLLG